VRASSEAALKLKQAQPKRTMPYSTFTTLAEVQEAFGLQLENLSGLFRQVQAREPSPQLQAALAENTELALSIASEKARSELIVTPILLEVRRLVKTDLSYFSGVSLNVEPSIGLNGECDFMFSRSSNQFEVSSPVVTIVEAKRNDISSGLGQCAAQMVGAQKFNERKGDPQTTILGGVTTGEVWRFLLLKDNVIQVDLSSYYLHQLPDILGILVSPFVVEV